MKKLSYHIFFWLFIFLYEFDYLIDKYNSDISFAYSAFEVGVYFTEFYSNLIIFIPFFLIKKGRVAYFISLIILLSAGFSIYYFAGVSKILLAENLQRAIISYILNHCLFIFISYIVWFFNQYYMEKQMRLQSENEKLQAEMLLLKSQISPHFLFNTLNNIYSLTLIKDENAPKMIAVLADVLRYFLYESSNEKTLLDSEIEVIQKYLQIQRYRQASGIENINFVFSNSNSLKQIPPLLLITLVENSFKHGDIFENKKGFVKINLYSNEDEINFTISNSFFQKINKNGIGLKNLENQLKILFGKNYQFKIDDKHNIFKANLIINAK